MAHRAGITARLFERQLEQKRSMALVVHECAPMPAALANKSDPLAHLRVLSMKQVSELTHYTPQHIYRLERAKKFPSRIRLGANRVGWRLADVEKWFADLPTVEPSASDEAFD